MNGDHRTPLGADADGPTFAEPWQARAFALAVALTDEGSEERAWAGFQRELVAELEADPGADGGDEDAYYRAWLAALERFLADREVVDGGALAARAAEFAAGDRDAHEFVEGDPHAHADRLPDGHADGSDHRHGHGHDRGRDHDQGRDHSHDH